MERLVREPTSGALMAARLEVKGGSFRDLPITKEGSPLSGMGKRI
jgi:hypothetical protein